jgi:hypothetical protein
LTAQGSQVLHCGLLADWVPVLGRNLDAMNPDPQPGYVWLNAPQKVLHVEERVLEFTEVLPGE